MYHHHHAIAGLYVSGWAGTGPVGVILSTMTVGFDVGRAVLKDLQEGKLTVRAGRDAALETLKHRGEIWFCLSFCLMYEEKTSKSFSFVGMKFCGLTMIDMFVDT